MSSALKFLNFYKAMDRRPRQKFSMLTFLSTTTTEVTGAVRDRKHQEGLFKSCFSVYAVY